MSPLLDEIVSDDPNLRLATGILRYGAGRRSCRLPQIRKWKAIVFILKDKVWMCCSGSNVGFSETVNFSTQSCAP
jgi:hypothetical protein